MTSLSLSDSRRRFLQMLWLSAALHAAVIGLTRLPQQTMVAAPPELQVQLTAPLPAAQVSSAIPEATPAPEPAVAPVSTRPVALPAPQPVPTPAPQPMPRPVASTPAQASPPAVSAVPSAALSRDAPNSVAAPQLSIPQIADMRYYAVKELDALPAALRKPDPVYPPQAEDQGVSGSVLLRLHLEADGSISQSEVVAATPSGVFGELFRKSALDAVRTLKFRPAKRNGLPVRALVEFRVVFEQDAN